MTTFHHGGRIGDCIYAMYTAQKLGGGDIYLSLYHRPGWSKGHIEILAPLLEYQDYISSASYIQIGGNELDDWRRGGPVPQCVQSLDYNLHYSETLRNPHEFPEWKGHSGNHPWPGNCHQGKRYAVGFDVEWDFDAKWMDAPDADGESFDIVFHGPWRRLVRSPNDWQKVLKELSSHFSIAVLGGGDDIDEWPDLSFYKKVVPSDLLQTASLIKSSKAILGSASCCYAIAEAMKSTRFLEMAPGCDNNYPYGKTGHDITGMPNGDLVKEVIRVCS